MGQAFLKQNVKTIGGLPYKLVGEIDVSGSAVTRVDFTGLSFTSDNDLLLVSDINNTTVTDTNYSLGFNDNDTQTQYYYQQLFASSTSVSGSRANNAYSLYAFANTKSVSNSKIKLTESGNLVSLNKNATRYGSANIDIVDSHATSVVADTAISKLSIIANITNAIGIGSNFKLYKLIADKVADVEVTDSAVTQVDLTGLSIDKDSEYMLVSDVVANGNASCSLFINDNVTESNYYTQRLYVFGTTLAPDRVNRPNFSFSPTGSKSLSIVKIKLTNSGFFTFQSDLVREYGGGSIGLQNLYGSSTFSLLGITKLNIVSGANAIGIGSRFTLYKIK